jgi:large subunit ribosomal protein L7e
MIEMLRIVEPYVTYGYPSLQNIRELIYKRGYAQIDNQRIPIVDNLVVESALGNLGIICVEDVIDQIFTVGPNFKTVNRFLWPFQLSNPRGGMRGRKTRHFIKGGETGNREEEINKLIKRMN